MLGQVADVVTILVLGSSVMYAVWRFLMAARERAAAAGTTRALISAATSIVVVFVLLTALIWQVSNSLRRAGELEAEIARARDWIADLESRVSLQSHVHSADYDSGWVPIGRNCRVYQREIGFSGLPEHITAYYRVNGEVVVPWGMNQATHSNGALLDFGTEGTLYIRLPCGNNRARQLDFGSYRSRDDGRNEAYNNEDVEIRVLLWTLRGVDEGQ